MLTPEEEKKKREIFDAMAPRRQQRILKKGYDTWDPFQMPKDPLAQMRRDREGKQHALELFQRYLAETALPEESTEYLKGVMEMSEGVVGGGDRFRGMYAFACWYEKKGKE